MPPKKSGGSGAAGLETKDELKAVLLADSYGQAFWPVTLEVPKVLLPLVNVPMIDYSLEWLAASRVEEVFVVCCAHAAQIKKHITDSKWGSQKSFKVTVVVSKSSTSLGDALRAIDSRGCISSDFVLLSADTVTNMDLERPLAEHKARRDKDRNAIMTLVAKQVLGPTARLRLGCKPLLLAVDPSSQRLLRYQALESRSRPVKVDAHSFGERDAVHLRMDLLDCQIQICAPEVLMLFTDNFDYQDLRQHFIPGVLSEEELGNKLYLHTLTHEYAAKVGNARAYDAVSRDLVQRWCFPFVPDTNLLPLQGQHGQPSYRYHRDNVYREQGVVVARDAKLLHDSAVGAGTHIDQSAVVISSVIGRGCRIGKGAHIEGSYLHDDVTVWEGALVESAMLCGGVTVMPKARIGEGVIVSFKAVIGPGQTVAREQRITLCRQVSQDCGSDDERHLGSQAGESSTFGSADYEPAHYGEQPSVAHVSDAAAAAAGNSLPNGTGFDEVAVGKGGAGFLWEQHLEEREAARTSLAQPILGDQEDGNSSDEASITTVEDMASDAIDPPEEAAEMMFKQEVTETVLRCVRDRHNLDNAIVELNSLKLAENRTFADVAKYVLSTLLSLCLQAPARVEGEYRDLFPEAMPASDKELVARLEAVVKTYGRLLQQYLKGSEEQVDILLTLEEFCSEEAPFGPASHGKRFVPVFARVLQLLYDADFIAEESFLEWAEEKQHGEEDEKIFLKKAEPFLEWLREADEESDEDSE